MKTDELKIDIEGRDKISEFMFGKGYKGMYSTKITWNEIMPVVEKIEALELPVTGYRMFIVAIENATCSIRGNTYGFHPTKAKTKIEAVYKAVVSFIDWYNNTSQTLKK